MRIDRKRQPNLIAAVCAHDGECARRRSGLNAAIRRNRRLEGGRHGERDAVLDGDAAIRTRILEAAHEFRELCRVRQVVGPGEIQFQPVTVIREAMPHDFRGEFPAGTLQSAVYARHGVRIRIEHR